MTTMVAFIRSGEGEIPLALPQSDTPNPGGGEFQMINGGDFQMIIDTLNSRASSRFI